MRVCFALLLGVSLLQPAAAHAQASGAKPAAQAQARKEAKVPEKVLKTYVGEYERGEGGTLTISLKDGYLWGQPAGQGAQQLFPESDTVFFLKELPFTLTFQKDAKGAVTGVKMVRSTDGAEREYKKIK